MTELKFSDLKKACKKDLSPFPVLRAALLGDCATQLTGEALRGTAALSGLNLELYDAPYDQLLFQTMEPGSELFAFHPDCVILHLCTEKLQAEFLLLTNSEKEHFAENVMARIRELWERLRQKLPIPVLQFDFPETDDGVFGNFGGKTPASFLFQIRKLNYLFSEEASRRSLIYPISLNALCRETGIKAFHDPKLYHLARMPLSMEILPEAAKRVMDTLLALRGRFRKCLILDLDNTLWGGVVGDDGWEGIRIGELGDGRIYSEIQGWCRLLKERGILLAVCSKNERETALEPFRRHPEMLLKEEDFVIFLANWKDKPENIREIQRKLNISFDSMVFLDDNPFERAAVRSLIPDITVPELPEQPEEYLPYLRNLNLFETVSFSGEDEKRTLQYRAETERAELQETFASYDNYLKAIQMVADVKAFDSFNSARISQLTQRSNQFNLRTKRYTEEEILQFGKSEQHLTFSFSLRDRFGDHGIIGAVILEKRPEGVLFIDTFLMSCRVLKRGMEEFVFNRIFETARDSGFSVVEGEYLPTRKNGMVRDLYPRMGLIPAGENRFRKNVSEWENKPVTIREAKDENKR